MTAEVDGRTADLGPARQRCVLAALAVDAGRAVPGDVLAERVWGAAVPRRVRPTLSSYVSRLRQALAGTDPVDIVRRSGGYALVVEETAVDLHRFRSLCAQARAEPDDRLAEAVLTEALDLWRGPALAGLDGEWALAERARLHQERLGAESDRTDLRLRLGHRGGLVAELASRNAEHPFDERIAEQYLLALHRAGRTADALEAYHRVRTLLAEELGADPGLPLRRLHQRILAADPALSAETTTRDGLEVVPRQLPAAPGSFTGRARELALLDARQSVSADGRAAICVLTGAGGVGKSWLALRWAHLRLDRFPDGHLFVDLRGFSPVGEPLAPGAVLHEFLQALGVDPVRIPADLEARVGRYRSLVADRRMLVVLDNARDTAQVLPLLPGGATCAVLVTSRDRLAGLITSVGARPVPVPVLTRAEATDVLAEHLGRDRLAAEPDAADELVDHCAGLPLALAIVANRAVAHPGFPLGTWTAELRDTATRLTALDGGEPATSAAAVLSWSFRSLTDAQQRVLGLLGWAPGPDIGLPAAARLAALDQVETRAVLRSLEQVSLVEEHVPGRYRMHDLVRRTAADLALRVHPDGCLRAAVKGLVEYYVLAAHAADRLLHPHRERTDFDPTALDCPPHPFPDRAAALAWFDAEHLCLLATQQLAEDEECPVGAWYLAWYLSTYHRQRGHLHEDVAVWRLGLGAATRLGDPARELVAHRGLGSACARVGAHAEALEHLNRALALARDTGDTTERAHTDQALAQVWHQRGENERALDHTSRALLRYAAEGDPAREAEALSDTGWYLALLGRYAEGRVACEAALSWFRRHGHRSREAAVRDTLGVIARRTGRHGEALDHHRHALDLHRLLGDSYAEADALDHLGHTHLALGGRARAGESWQRALELYRSQHREREAERVADHLGA
ncbi:tetratricopeptide repeat protein [Actinokineospora sp. PR83]|nr:tetratricopeptide repeat protein [Actinokineospora sp. PR83]